MTGRCSAFCPSSAAPPISRKKSSLATLVCSLTRSFTKSVHPVPNAMLGGILESAVCGKSVPGSGGTCSRGPTGHAARTCEQGGSPDLLARGRHGQSMAIWVGVLRVCGHGSAGGALRSPARHCYGQPCGCEPVCDSDGEGRHAVRR
jgi:hypothetical protein